MAIFKVEGGRRLRGEITPQGAKNEALQILCATLLTQEKVIVHNVPQILDVIQLIELLQAMGVEEVFLPAFLVGQHHVAQERLHLFCAFICLSMRPDGSGQVL